jgi:hypothetical protein
MVGDAIGITASALLVAGIVLAALRLLFPLRSAFPRNGRTAIARINR